MDNRRFEEKNKRGRKARGNKATGQSYDEIIVEAIMALSHLEDETVDEYIQRLLLDSPALKDAPADEVKGWVKTMRGEALLPSGTVKQQSAPVVVAPVVVREKVKTKKEADLSKAKMVKREKEVQEEDVELPTLEISFGRSTLQEYKDDGELYVQIVQKNVEDYLTDLGLPVAELDLSGLQGELIQCIGAYRETSKLTQTAQGGKQGGKNVAHMHQDTKFLAQMKLIVITFAINKLGVFGKKQIADMLQKEKKHLQTQVDEKGETHKTQDPGGW